MCGLHTTTLPAKSNPKPSVQSTQHKRKLSIQNAAQIWKQLCANARMCNQSANGHLGSKCVHQLCNMCMGMSTHMSAHMCTPVMHLTITSQHDNNMLKSVIILCSTQ